ncbi:MAG: DUF2783 domain-containing protein [Pseudomonadota bacterium]
MSNLDIGQDQLGNNGDAFYEALMKAHEGLSAEQSRALNTRLVLLLANQVSDFDVLKAVLSAASDISD